MNLQITTHWLCARQIENEPREDDNGLCESRRIEVVNNYALHGRETRCKGCGLVTCITFGTVAERMVLEADGHLRITTPEPAK